MLVRHAIRSHIRDFARDERGTATMEFTIMFPVTMILFVAVVETGMILARQVLMERSLDEAVRTLRLVREITDPTTGELRGITANDVEDAICDNTSAIPKCDEVLVVDLEILEPADFEIPEQDVLCVDRTDIELRPANSFQQGVDNELVMIRVCAIIDRVLPFSGFGLNLTRDETGGLHMVATSILVNEPQ